MIRLSKSGIEYLDYGWNFMSGCRHKESLDSARLKPKCPPVTCWAAEFVKRFPKVYPDGFEPHIYPEAFLSPLGLKKPSRIGVCFMGDLFGEWVDPSQRFYDKDNILLTLNGYYKLRDMITSVILECPQDTFIFLTKNLRGALRWGRFPENCEVGFSAWSPDSFNKGLEDMMKVEAKVKWCSLEPLLSWGDFNWGSTFKIFDWVAIGALTGTKKQMMELAPRYPDLTPMKLGEKGNRWGLMPPLEWIKNIVEACDGSTESPRSAAGTKVFLKDNLRSLIDKEFPDPSELDCDHNRLFRTPHPILCKNCESLKRSDCPACGVIWNLRQECGASDRRLGQKAREKE